MVQRLARLGLVQCLSKKGHHFHSHGLAVASRYLSRTRQRGTTARLKNAWLCASKRPKAIRNHRLPQAQFRFLWDSDINGDK